MLVKKLFKDITKHHIYRCGESMVMESKVLQLNGCKLLIWISTEDQKQKTKENPRKNLDYTVNKPEWKTYLFFI